ncbi:MAG TPA: hypothetical protein DEF41_10665 [Desulfovibrio sp.]|jgi:hypothetical protein|uniref:Uncharacterized protein n=3 Tax=Nitratidesulfovibrio vulgaris TaxID=881 RepID=Q72CU5_NITV2|nr:hypothetical protein DVU_1188 [Nitratidesulfovibrio vulgaris str. Hildenborough]ABM28886.1 conserved hypothetical protein [Nitratidesulfovibrio vulgaris DP4]HBW16566.1 hypothetical protein [Desulfovibrio sp.]
MPRHRSIPVEVRTMFVTASDAAARICPLLPPVADKPAPCQGSACMMWRFRYPERRSVDDTGYCGLAGKPAGAM